MVQFNRQSARRALRRSVPKAARAWLRAPAPESRRLLAESSKAALRKWHRDALVPCDQVLRLRRLLPFKDALLPDNRSLAAAGSALTNSFLRQHLSTVDLGTWSLSVSALDFLERQIQLFHPASILEFGSGVSTACLARYMQELHGEGEHVYVYSIDQAPEYAQRTIDLLASLGLQRYARVVAVPLLPQTIAGLPTVCYSLPEPFLGEFLEDARPDMVLVDGPATNEGRFGTLPLVHGSLARDARFYLDDALRDDELRDAAVWAGLSYVCIMGYWLQDKGLLVGQVRRD